MSTDESNIIITMQLKNQYALRFRFRGLFRSFGQSGRSRGVGRNVASVDTGRRKIRELNKKQRQQLLRVTLNNPSKKWD